MTPRDGLLGTPQGLIMGLENRDNENGHAKKKERQAGKRKKEGRGGKAKHLISRSLTRFGKSPC